MKINTHLSANEYLKKAKKYAHISFWCFVLAFLVFVFGHLIALERGTRPAEKLNVMSTVWCASQVYLSDSYKQTGEIKYGITVKDLLDAELILHDPYPKFGKMTIIVNGFVENKGIDDEDPFDIKVVSGEYVYPR